ncbi:hypothetical protein [Calothrix sp. 336/3]|uniref:hypothetical protein n=1 Tax=Calothrix sp. 336/3 TaxID=1337936 RepID=UPI0004E3429F|nr:hypothetical protein [Calothrix sp. 336/3]AKG22707.1 hypothetical protein IJ00_16775 [Calothrix sp. 336/3]
MKKLNLGGLLGGKKKSNGFYLELDESGNEKAQEAITETVKQVEKKVAEVEATIKEAVKETASSKSKKAKSSPAPKQTEKAVTPAPAPAPAAPKIPTETAFASKYLIQTNTPRRRPGANMSSFLEMASQAKIPNNNN